MNKDEKRKIGENSFRVDVSNVIFRFHSKWSRENLGDMRKQKRKLEREGYLVKITIEKEFSLLHIGEMKKNE